MLYRPSPLWQAIARDVYKYRLEAPRYADAAPVSFEEVPMPAVKTKDGVRDLSDVLAEADAPKPVNTAAGEVAFTDHKGRSWTLRPTFEAAQEIENALGMSVVGLRTKFAMALTPGHGADRARARRDHRGRDPGGGRARQPRGARRRAAVQQAGVGDRIRQLRQPLSDFLWALCDGGRGRGGPGKSGLLERLARRRRTWRPR